VFGSGVGVGLAMMSVGVCPGPDGCIPMLLKLCPESGQLKGTTCGVGPPQYELVT